MAKLSKPQKKIARKILKVGVGAGASQEALVASMLTARVEANFSNPSSGHGTSVGWRQEIDSYGSVENRRDVKAAAGRFFDEAKDFKANDPGVLAQQIQKSAYPDRYGEHMKEGQRLVDKLVPGISGSSNGKKGSSGTKTTSKTVTTPGEPSRPDPLARLREQNKRTVSMALGADNTEASGAFDIDSRLSLVDFMTQPIPSTSEVVEGTKAKGGKGDQAFTASGKVVSPVKGYGLGGGYGTDRGTHTHAGADISAPQGTAVQAVMDGTVQIKSDPSGYGTYIDVVHKNGKVSRYAHLSGTSVKNGAKVRAGQTIGKVGSTGRSSGPHLHFEIRDGEGYGYEGTVDPAKFLNKKKKR